METKNYTVDKVKSMTVDEIVALLNEKDTKIASLKDDVESISRTADYYEKKVSDIRRHMDAIKAVVMINKY